MLKFYMRLYFQISPPPSPKSHLIPSLIVKQAHEHLLRNGVKETLAEISTEYQVNGYRSV